MNLCVCAQAYVLWLYLLNLYKAENNAKVINHSPNVSPFTRTPILYVLHYASFLCIHQWIRFRPEALIMWISLFYSSLMLIFRLQIHFSHFIFKPK